MLCYYSAFSAACKGVFEKILRDVLCSVKQALEVRLGK